MLRSGQEKLTGLVPPGVDADLQVGQKLQTILDLISKYRSNKYQYLFCILNAKYVAKLFLAGFWRVAGREGPSEASWHHIIFQEYYSRNESHKGICCPILHSAKVELFFAGTPGDREIDGYASGLPSSARKLKRSGADLLAGRAVMRSLHPFMAAELGSAFDLSKALQVGLLPLVWQGQDPEDILRSYVALYVREEVQMEGLVRRLAHFNRFLEAVSFSHGSLINMNAIAQECAIDRKTVDGYVGILEDLLLTYRIPVFTKRAKREMSAHPKFYFFDPGVFRSLRPKGPLDHPHEIDGHALEGLVAEHLRAWIDYGRREAGLFFWRTRSGNEVDFIVYGPKDFCAIEVKNAVRFRDEDLRGLHSFLDDFPEAKAIFLYRGTEKLRRGRVLCWRCSDFLLHLRPDKPILLN